MALRKFTPDPDLFDPEDDEAWYGTWEHDDGSSLYGQGDPEMGRELLAANDAQPAPASPYGQQNMSHAPREVLDAGMVHAPPRGLDPALEAESIGQPPPMIARPPEAPEPSPDWANDIPPAVAMALEQHAGDAGLNPQSVAAIIKHESGWNPAAVNSKTGKHAGLIQFSQDGWGEVAKAAGQPDVTWEEMRNMSAEEQLPFVVAYYKGKGLKPESTTADYAMRTFMPAYANEGDDFVLGEQGSQQMLGDVRSGKVFEQNQALDLNKDGKITKGEVGEAYAGQGARPGTAPAAVGGLAPRGTMPSSMGGLPMAEVQQSGIPLTPEQMAQRQSDVGQRYAAVAGMQQQAIQERIRGREEVQAEWQNAYQQQGQDAQAEQAKQAAIAAEAAQKIDQEVNQPIQRVDPKRYITEMSTGAAVLGAIGVVLAGLGQAKAMSMGMNPGANSGIEALSKAIDQDVQLQKEEIQQGRERSSNRIAHWSRILGNAEQGERAARAEAKQAAAGLLQAKAMKSDIAEIKAGGLQQAAALFAQGQQEIQAITDAERKNLTVRYATPPPRAGVDPVKAALEREQNAKILRQELILDGKTPEQADAALAAAGLPIARGETVDQNTARKGVEAKADEETSKELQPVAEAETMWRKALAEVKKLEDMPLTTKRGTKPGGFIEGMLSTVPGYPNIDQQNAFDQALTAASNAQIAALGRASDSDEDRIKHETLGGGDLASVRRGIQNQLEKLEERRRYLNARREGAADRVEQRQQADQMPTVTGKVYIPGQGPRR